VRPLALVAARAPERVRALVLLNPLPQGPESSGELHGWTEAERDSLVDGYRHAFANWGSGEVIDMWDPVQATAHNRRLMALLERSSTTPAAAQAYLDWILQIDIRDVLRSVQVPARILRIPTNRIPEAVSRYATELIPDATLHVLPATLPGASIGQAILSTVDHVEELATGRVHPTDADRFLGTVLFTDVVGSTDLLARVGDARYREMRSAHERLVRLALEREGGDLVNVMGDGTLSVFEGPSKAVRCAETICRDAADAGMEVRCGVHSGEVERDGSSITGMTVHIGARVGAAAGPGEVLVSRTVHDLVVGSGLEFVSRGEQELKGIPGQWELFAVTHAGEQAGSLPVEKSMQTTRDKMALESARRVPALSRATLRMANAIERRRARPN
jgi:class 3 adenylate cyclase